MIKVSFINPGAARDQAVIGKPGITGRFRATGRATDSVYVRVSCEGHYEATFAGLSKDRDWNLNVVLPRILKPIALHALTPGYSGDFTGGVLIPVHNEWVGFDFAAGDWVAPHGNGRITDIRLKFRREFKGYRISGATLEENLALSKSAAKVRKIEWSQEHFDLAHGKWDMMLEIGFTDPFEGIMESPIFLSYSKCKLPHQAPVAGYKPAWVFRGSSYVPEIARDDVGFFVKTRVVRDEQGKEISANYAKIMGDFNLLASGRLIFTYYFNPVPKDRNLEFNPSKNLFPPSKPMSRIALP